MKAIDKAEESHLEVANSDQHVSKRVDDMLNRIKEFEWN